MNAARPNPPLVATDLSTLDWPVASDSQTDIEFEGRWYRLLDPTYYAWLRSRMEIAQAAHKRGKLTSQAYDVLRTSFNELHDRAVALFGESSLLDAVRLLDPKSYALPGRAHVEAEARTHAETSQAHTAAPRRSPHPEGRPEDDAPLDGWSKHSYPAEDDPARLRFSQRITQQAVAQVDAIRDQALALGWTEPELYQNRGRFPFPCGGHYGLVCFLRRHLRVGQVTDKNIEIVYPDGHALRLYRKEVTA